MGYQEIPPNWPVYQPYLTARIIIGIENIDWFRLPVPTLILTQETPGYRVLSVYVIHGLFNIHWLPNDIDVPELRNPKYGKQN